MGLKCVVDKDVVPSPLAGGGGGGGELGNYT